MTDKAEQVDELQASIDAELVEQEQEPESHVEEVAENPETPVESAPTQVDDVDSPAEPDAVQKRINKITADKYEQKRRADALEQEIQALKAAQSESSNKPNEAPKLEDFDYDDAKYSEALIEYRINQKLQAADDQRRQNLEMQKRQQVAESFNTKVAEFVETAPDYAETVSSLPQLPSETLEAVMSLDNGPQIAYYLGKHLDVADQIANSSPMMAAMKLGEIRAQLANSPKSSAKPKSKAPDPVETVTGGGSAQKDMGEMSMEEIYNL